MGAFDVVGRRRSCIIGSLINLLATFLGLFCNSYGFMVGIRIVQGEIKYTCHNFSAITNETHNECKIVYTLFFVSPRSCTQTTICHVPFYEYTLYTVNILYLPMNGFTHLIYDISLQQDFFNIAIKINE